MSSDKEYFYVAAPITINGSLKLSLNKIGEYTSAESVQFPASILTFQDSKLESIREASLSASNNLSFKAGYKTAVLTSDNYKTGIVLYLETDIHGLLDEMKPKAVKIPAEAINPICTD